MERLDGRLAAIHEDLMGVRGDLKDLNERHVELLSRMALVLLGGVFTLIGVIAALIIAL